MIIMKEYRITPGNRLRLLVLGGSFTFLGIFWFRQALAKEAQDWLMPLDAFLIIYGAIMLAKPFFSRLATGDTEVFFKDGLMPARLIAYRDVAAIALDALRMRVIFELEEGGRYAFEYIYEDLQGFLDRMTAQGIDIVPNMRENAR